MGENSAIAWTDHTYNPWRGCTKVGPGCDGCYAEARDRRYEGGKHWGAGAPRIRASEETRKLPFKIARRLREGIIPLDHNKMFSLSLGDAFDNEVAPEWRKDYWDVLRATPELRHQIVTKRIGNATDMLPYDWRLNFRHCGIIATMVNQAEFDRDIGKLQDVKHRFGVTWVGVSIEPQIGHVDIAAGGCLDWVITGGESYQPPHETRPYDIEWARSLIRQCRLGGVACFVKQIGALPYSDGRPMHGGGLRRQAGDDPAGWPEDLRVRQFPKALLA